MRRTRWFCDKRCVGMQSGSFLLNSRPSVVGMEACSGAHYWAKVLFDLGHEVRLISPQFVTTYVKSNKNDRNDAGAICEAFSRPSMRFVPPKSSEQLAIQAVHRTRLVIKLVGYWLSMASQFPMTPLICAVLLDRSPKELITASPVSSGAMPEFDGVV